MVPLQNMACGQHGQIVRSYLLLTIFWTMSAGAGCTTPAKPLSNGLEMFVREQVESLIQSDFPDLIGITIEYAAVTAEADTIFFETYVKASSVLRNPKKRTYQIFANERLTVHRPDLGAVRAILVHELLHIRDYLEKSFWQLLQLKQNYEDITFQRQYERFTDQRTLEMGYGAGLARYRRWVYSAIADPEKIALKRQIYMTPEEIVSWLNQQH